MVLKSKIFLFLFMVCGFFSSGVQAAPLIPVAPQFLSHKAQYEIRLKQTRNDSQIINVSGVMDFLWQEKCDGFETNHKFKLRYDYADMPPVIAESTYALFELKEGDELNFFSTHLENGKKIEELRGQANLKKANFRKPAAKEFTLPSNTIFPTHYSFALMRAAQAGNKFYAANVFDGSELQNAVEMTALIGKAQNFMPTEAQKIALKESAENLKTRAWPLRLAFFLNEEKAENEAPNADYEMSLMMHENGVISDMVIDYPDFSLTQKLVRLEALKPESCNP